jgi:alpha-beta hydrolase superfamily lysophospholipase
LLSLGFFALLSFSQGRETYADLPGVRLWYKDTGGNGVPVVFLHSNTGSSQNWEYQIPPFTAAGFRLIGYDRRGWGRSMAQPGAQPGTAADDLRALMKFLASNGFTWSALQVEVLWLTITRFLFRATAKPHRREQHRRRAG